MPFQAFWPIYLAEHRNPLNRRLHFLGTGSSLGLAVGLLLMGLPRWIWVAPVVAYGFAWAGHFLVEHNRPATFRHPWLSLMGDHKMAWYALRGRLEQEYERLGIRDFN